jgi:uncharacterized ferritin-like protein (DUF455 family)
MIHEARGLDVNPETIQKFKNAGDEFAVKRLEEIHADEIGHCASGHRWFSYLCEQNGMDKYAMFHSIGSLHSLKHLVDLHFVGKLKPPFNHEDRKRAGIDEGYYSALI